MSDEKKKNDNSEVLVDQAWRAGDRSKRFYEMTYAGATSFLRRKYSKELNGVDIAVSGGPFDSAVTNRPGCRLGPRAIRSSSVELASLNSYPFGFDPFQHLNVIDYGDCYLNTHKPETIEEIWELAGGHPYYTQLLCFSLFQQARKLNQWNVNPQDIEGIIDESLGKGEAAFVSTTEILSPREKLVLYAVAEAQKIATNSSQSDIFNPLVILERHHVKLTKKTKLLVKI